MRLDPATGLKWCPKCKTDLPAAEFNKTTKNSDGLHGYCRGCSRAYVLSLREGDPEKYRVSWRKYDADHREERRVTAAQYAKEHREERNEYGKRSGQTPKGKLRSYRSNAKVRGLSFSISKEDFFRFMEQPCFWCGGAAGGIDRLNNGIGYELSNCVPCCKMCNIAKNNYSVAEFKEWIGRLISHTQHSVESLPEGK